MALALSACPAALPGTRPDTGDDGDDVGGHIVEDSTGQERRGQRDAWQADRAVRDVPRQFRQPDAWQPEPDGGGGVGSDKSSQQRGIEAVSRYQSRQREGRYVSPIPRREARRNRQCWVAQLPLDYPLSLLCRRSISGPYARPRHGGTRVPPYGVTRRVRPVTATLSGRVCRGQCFSHAVVITRCYRVREWRLAATSGIRPGARRESDRRFQDTAAPTLPSASRSPARCGASGEGACAPSVASASGR
jgi:hypothetical protein